MSNSKPPLPPRKGRTNAQPGEHNLNQVEHGSASHPTTGNQASEQHLKNDPVYLDMSGGGMKMEAPWRKFTFGGRERTDLKEFVSSYMPIHATGVETVNILVVGQIGAGKSSFFNTINSIYREQITSQAPTGTDTESLTKQFRYYDIRAARQGQPMHFRLCDTMGLEEGPSKGMDITDFHFLLDGLVPDRFQFQTKKRFSQSISFEASRPLADQIHVVAMVIDANCVEFIDGSIVDQLRDIRAQANRRALPVAILLTKIDKVCPSVGRDIAMVFSSDAVDTAVKKAAELLQMPPSYVLPVKNYDAEIILNDEVDILALFAIKHLLGMADGYLDEQLSRSGNKMSESPFLDGDGPWRAGFHSSPESLVKLRREVESYQPPGAIKFARILLLGPKGAGKSSFFNTVNSIYRGNITAQATVGNEKQSTTIVHREYAVRAGRTGPVMNFRVCDTMGLDEAGMDLPTTRCLLKGLITNGYEYRVQLVEDVDTKRKMELADKVHVVALMVDAVQVNSLPIEVQAKLTSIAKECRSMGMQVVVILTKIDNVCDKVRRDITKVYHSIKVHDCVTKLAAMLSIPAAHIFPVKNYETELELQEGMDILALSALKHLLNLADNYIEDHLPTDVITRARPVESTVAGTPVEHVSDDQIRTMCNQLGDAVGGSDREQPVSIPVPVHPKPATHLPPGWHVADHEGTPYYYNSDTGARCWEIPRAWSA